MDTGLASLWLPILVSGIALFFTSWIAWMAMPHHKGEWKTLPNETEFESVLRAGGIAPGQYMFPHMPTTPEEWKSETFQARMKSGPNGLLYVWELGSGMGSKMFCTWLLFTVLSFVIAYLAGMVLPPGESRFGVFRFVATAGVLTYANAGLLHAIWFRRRVWGGVMDGIAYALVTGAVFAWLWPGTM